MAVDIKLGHGKWQIGAGVREDGTPFMDFTELREPGVIGQPVLEASGAVPSVVITFDDEPGFAVLERMLKRLRKRAYQPKIIEWKVVVDDKKG